MVKNGYVLQKSLETIAKYLQVNIKLSKSTQTRLDYFPKSEYNSRDKIWRNGNPVINLRSEENHYFWDSDERLPIKEYAIKNYDRVKGFTNWWEIGELELRGSRYKPRRNKGTNLTVFQLYKVLKNNNWLHPIKNCMDIYKIQYWNNHEFKLANFEFSNIQPNYKVNIEKTIDKDKKSNGAKILFFDFEADTRGLPMTDEEINNIINLDERQLRTYDGKHRAYMGCAEFDTGEKRTFTDNINFKWSGRNMLLWANKMMEDNYSDIVKKMPILDELGEKTDEKILGYDLVMVAHYAYYDIKFISKFLSNYSEIVVGTSLKAASGTFKSPYCDKPLIVKIIDSINFLPFALDKFGKNLHFKQEKDVMPYHAYTIDNLRGENPKVDLDEILDEWENNAYDADKKKQQFCNNLNQLNMIDDNMVDMIGYAEYYCKLDVEVLAKGFLKYQALMEDAVGEKCIDYLGLPSMANGYCEKNGVFEDVLKVSGLPQFFIQRSLVGGRCMTRNNCKWIVKPDMNIGTISDYDCTSEYPSACERLGLECGGFLKGAPQIIKDADQFDRMKDCITTELTRRPVLIYGEDFKNKTQVVDVNEEVLRTNWDGYFVEVKIKNVRKPRYMPLESFKDSKTNIRNFTNDLEYEHSGKTLFLNRFSFEDLVKYQDVEYEFVRGYYFNYGRNDSITKAIRTLFDERNVYKKVVYYFTEDFEVITRYDNKQLALNDFNQKHNTIYTELEEVILENNEKLLMKDPKEACFKLIMNIIYGRSSMKAPETETSYISMWNNETGEEDWSKVNNFYEYNYNHIQSFTEIDDGKLMKFKKTKELNNHFNRVHIASEILGMSKRIMNEVITTAEDLNIPIFITDTDSLHLPTNRIPALEAEYDNRYGDMRKQIYGRTLGLNGKDLGQFHTDFEMNGCRNVEAVEAVFLWKKSYWDKLRGIDNKSGELKYDNHTRMKGIPSVLIKEPEKIFKAHYDLTNENINQELKVFDLKDGGKKVKFKNMDNNTTKTLVKFERSINFERIPIGILTDLPKKQYIL